MIVRWNVKDLAHHASVPAQRILRFENGQEPLYAEEINKLLKAFDEKDIYFTEGGGIKQRSSQKQVVKNEGNTDDAALILARLLGKQGEGES